MLRNIKMVLQDVMSLQAWWPHDSMTIAVGHFTAGRGHVLICRIPRACVSRLGCRSC